MATYSSTNGHMRQLLSVALLFLYRTFRPQTPSSVFSYSADEGLRGRNVLNKNYSCYVTTLERWHTHPLVQVHMYVHKSFAKWLSRMAFDSRLTCQLWPYFRHNKANQKWVQSSKLVASWMPFVTTILQNPVYKSRAIDQWSNKVTE